MLLCFVDILQFIFSSPRQVAKWGQSCECHFADESSVKKKETMELIFFVSFPSFVVQDPTLFLILLFLFQFLLPLQNQTNAFSLHLFFNSNFLFSFCSIFDLKRSKEEDPQNKTNVKLSFSFIHSLIF